MLGKLKNLLGFTPRPEQAPVAKFELPSYEPPVPARKNEQDDSTRPSTPVSRFETTDLQKALDLAG